MKGPLPANQVISGGFDIVSEAQIKAGQISELDVRVYRAILELEQKLQKRFPATYVRAFDLDDVIVVVCEGSIGPLIGAKGANIQALQTAIQKRLRIVTLSNEPKTLLSDMLGPRVKITSKTTVFAPEGERTRLLVNKKTAGPRLARHAGELSEWISQLTKTRAEVAFE